MYKNSKQSISFINLLLLVMGFLAQSTMQMPCNFNKLCFCTNYQDENIIQEVNCIGVPMISLDQIPKNHYYRIGIRGARDIRQLKNNELKNISVSSLSLSKTRLSLIEPFAFSGLEQALTALELSHGNIKEFPSESLSSLQHLQWINLRGNEIEKVNRRDFKKLISLKSLLLSDNSLSVIEDQTFKDIINLEYLELDDNLITRIEGNPFPSGLTTLSLANCLLQELHVNAISNLKNIKFLQFRGNLIRHLSHLRLPTDHLELLDLSHNLISSLDHNAFHNVFHSKQNINSDNPLTGKNTNPKSNNTFGNNIVNSSDWLIHITDLHLDMNFIQSLPSEAFKHISVERLSLSNNHITAELIAHDAFVGPLQTKLILLDLNYNLLEMYPKALLHLKQLKQLFIKSNKLKFIDETSFANFNHLEAIDLSKNLLTRVPRAFKHVKSLIKLNLQDNYITIITDDDFSNWSTSLSFLNLAKNRIKIITANAFNDAKNLRELKLAGNNVYHLDSNVIISLPHLESLELSYCFTTENDENLKEIISKVPPSLKLLQIDYNNLKYFHHNALNSFNEIIHIDLEGNQIEFIDNKLFSKASHVNSIILNRNKLKTIKSKTFSNLARLENIALYHNQLETIEASAFCNLPKLNTLILSKNNISKIQPNSFYNLSSSSSLSILLNENKLNRFSFSIFKQMSKQNVANAMYINVSHNEIHHLEAVFMASTNEISNSTLTYDDFEQKQTFNVRVLDLSHNKISHLPNEFTETICLNLQALHMEYNTLTNIPVEALQQCNELQILILDHNEISDHGTNQVNTTCCSNLKVFSLRHNKISKLNNFESIFSNMNNLRVLDLADNFISIVPDGVFYGTKLHRLVLARNRLDQSIIEKQTFHNCFSVKETLAYLDLSHNKIDKVPFHVTSCENLIELNLANNIINEFTEHSFAMLNQLFELDISNNPIEKIHSKTFFKTMPLLDSLKLINNSLFAVPILALPQLNSIDLSHNMIATISSSSFTKTRKITILNLSNNQLSDVPKHIWRYMIDLRYLNLAYNPIDILDTSSFAELKKLSHLDIQGLALHYVDTRLLHHHRFIISIKTSTYPNVRSFRLHDLLSKSHSLKSATIEVQESILSYQIQWAFGTKLRELIITGSNLKNIFPDAFLGLHQTHELILRITKTNVTNLPNGMLRYLSGIRYMTVDLRNNKLTSLKPEVFMLPFNEKENYYHLRNLNLAGGILLDDNPLICECSLLWISDWLRKWIYDMRIINFEAAVQAYSIAHQSTCSIHTNESNESIQNYGEKIKRISILDLRSNEITCENQSINCIVNNAVLAVILFINLKLQADVLL